MNEKYLFMIHDGRKIIKLWFLISCDMFQHISPLTQNNAGEIIQNYYSPP